MDIKRVTSALLGFPLVLAIFLIGNKYLALGFTTGYILHIVCDRFSPRGKNLKFFEIKLPCRNSKNKTSIDW